MVFSSGVKRSVDVNCVVWAFSESRGIGCSRCFVLDARVLNIFMDFGEHCSAYNGVLYFGIVR